MSASMRARGQRGIRNGSCCVMIEGYDPERAVLVVVHITPLFMVYRLDRTPGAPPPDAPLIDFDQ